MSRDLRLPDLPRPPVPGGWLARHAFAVFALVLLALVGLGAAALAGIEVELSVEGRGLVDVGEAGAGQAGAAKAVLDLPPRQAARVRLGDRVELDPASGRRGEVIRVSVAEGVVEVAFEGSGLRPGQSVRGRILTGPEPLGRLVLRSLRRELTPQGAEK